jgi:DNA-binding transcriptional LysR family regulator
VRWAPLKPSKVKLIALTASMGRRPGTHLWSSGANGTADGFWCGSCHPTLVPVLDHPKLRVEMFQCDAQSRPESLRSDGSGGGMDRSRNKALKCPSLPNHFLQIVCRHIPARAAAVIKRPEAPQLRSLCGICASGRRASSSHLPMPETSFRPPAFAQTEAVRRNAGIGLLPNFMVSGNRASPGVVGCFSPAAPFRRWPDPESFRSALGESRDRVDPARSGAEPEHTG